MRVFGATTACSTTPKRHDAWRDYPIWTLGRTTTGIENSAVVLRCQHAMPLRLHLFDSLLLPKFTPMNIIKAGVDTPMALKLIN